MGSNQRKVSAPRFMNEILNNVKAIAFDFDGVIVDSQSFHYEAWRQTLKHFGVNHRISEQDILGLSASHFAKSFNLPFEQLDRMIERKRKLVIKLAHQNPPPLFSHVKSTIKALSREYQLAVVSSGEKDVVLATLKYYDLMKYFAHLILEGDYKNPKPDPEPYLVCLNKFCLRGAQVLAIEDSESGIISALKAGLKVIAFSNTLDGKKLQEAHLIIHSFEELLRLLNLVDAGYPSGKRN
jgi:HAD superfamily hydrolase (TIGR01509 family)